MDKVSERLGPIQDLVSRFTEPAKYKLKFYHIALIIFIEHILSRIVLKFEEKKKNQNRFKNDLYSSETFKHAQAYVGKLYAYISHGIEYLQSMNESCVGCEQTSILFCEPYIHSGFRPTNKPYMYYIKSLFSKHNETVNAWSHYLGTIYTLSLAVRYDFTDPYSWPILTCILTTSILFFTSATAHLMHQKSHGVHMTCFLCDYSGISFNVFGCALMINYICSPVWYYNLIKPFLLPYVGFLSVVCAIMMCLGQTLFKRPYPPMKRLLQFLPCIISCVATNLPILIQYFSTNKDLVLNYEIHFKSYILIIIGAVCFALDIPQRFYPGKMDFIGQGHHLFHICVFMVSMVQLDGTYGDYVINRDIIAASRPPPTFIFCFGSLFVVVIYYIYLVRCFYRSIEHCFDENGNTVELESIKNE